MAVKPLIFSTHSLHTSIIDQLEALGTLRIASEPSPRAINEESKGANFIVVRAPIDPAIVKREGGLHALVRHGAGLDMIPVEACTAAGVLVANVPGANASTVAEHAIWTAMALLRQYPMVNRDLRETGWEAGRAHSNNGLELSGRTMGIVGMGNVGRALCHMAVAAFGMPVLTFTRTPKNIPEAARSVTLHELLSSSDVVVLCCPLSEQTRGMIGRSELALLNRDCVLVNVSRGPVIDETALVETLSSGHIRGVALDVFNQHPIASDHPLFGFDNVILTPHMAGITNESMLRMGQGVVNEIARIIAGKMPENLINPGALQLYQKRFAAT